MSGNCGGNNQRDERMRTSTRLGTLAKPRLAPRETRRTSIERAADDTEHSTHLPANEIVAQTL